MKAPTRVSIAEAARALGTFPGNVQKLMGVKLVTGHETVPTAKLAKALNCQPAMLAAFLLGHDKALTKQEVADALGINIQCMNRPRQFRATILPVVNLGRGGGRGHRFSFNAVQAQLALERSHPRLKRQPIQHCPAQPVYQPVPA